jgi:Fic family protein
VKRNRTGTYETTSAGGETVKAFVPAPLPPVPPPALDGRVRTALDAALLALGRLDGVSSVLPDTHLLLYTYVRKEAVLSSQIEGTQSTLADLLLFELKESPGVPLDDVIEVSNYVRALEHGVKRMRGGFPLSNRLIRELHEILLSRGRGAGKSPGEFRRSQKWIGGTRPGNARFVPPPPHRVPDAMGTLETFVHDTATPALVKAALWHVQFETIHPFLDGNGRVGRLMVTLLLCAEGVLREPMLYLSLFLKQHRTRYYELLDAVRRDGDWEAWVAFLLRGRGFGVGQRGGYRAAPAGARRDGSGASGEPRPHSRLRRRGADSAPPHAGVRHPAPRQAHPPHPADHREGARCSGEPEDRERDDR